MKEKIKKMEVKMEKYMAIKDEEFKEIRGIIANLDKDKSSSI